MNRHIILRSKAFSWIVHKKSVVVCLTVVIASFIAVIISLGLGSTAINPLDVVKSLFGLSSSTNQLIITSLRLPRTLTAFLVGACLGLSGAILQGIVKNPLASPSILGMVDGGTLGALAFLSLFLDAHGNSLTVSIFLMPLFAFIGSLIITGIILVVCYSKSREIIPLRLILMGIGMAGAARAITILLILAGPPIFIFEANTWMTGSIYGTNWNNVAILISCLLIFGTLAQLCSRELNMQQLDDQLIIGLGSNIGWRRLGLLLISVALSSCAVSMGGAISFISLVAPHIASRLTNSAYNTLMPLSALVGSVLVIFADLLARTALSPIDLPLGIFTSLLGAPFFIYLLWKQKGN